MNQPAFKFPDEVEGKKDEALEPEGVEIEVVDDTPPEDRGREPLPENIKKELEEDDLEEYSEKVKKRLSQMKKVWHDERREKEAALREREAGVGHRLQARQNRCGIGRLPEYSLHSRLQKAQRLGLRYRHAPNHDLRRVLREYPRLRHPVQN